MPQLHFIVKAKPNYDCSVPSAHDYCEANGTLHELICWILALACDCDFDRFFGAIDCRKEGEKVHFRPIADIRILPWFPADEMHLSVRQVIIPGGN